MTSIESGGIANVNALRQQFERQSLSPTTSPRTGNHGQSIIIVGAGAFGTSLALELVTNYRDKYSRNQEYVDVDMYLSMFSINGRYRPETRRRPIRRKLSERIISNPFMQRLRPKPSNFGRQNYTRERIIKQVFSLKLD
jgi:hypothetical protein